VQSGGIARRADFVGNVRAKLGFRPYQLQIRSALLAALLLLSACESIDSLMGRHHRPPDPVTARANNYDLALKLKGEGDCAKAIPLFQPLAKLGKDYAAAQLQLGECYLDVARSAATSEQAEQSRVQGASWILKAANSQLSTAQEQAAKLTLDGIGVAADPIEAGKWFLLLQRNPLRPLVGPAVIDPELQLRLQQRLTEADWQQARTRADQWQASE